MISLTIEKRDITGKKVAAQRALGMLPAVVYGPKQKSLSIILSLKEFERIYKEAGESSVVELKGLEKPIQVLIHTVEYEPVTSVAYHVDFYAIEKGAKVQVAVPVVFTGESPAVKAGANLVKILHEIEIEAEATKIPHDLTVDISTIKEFEDQIRVSEVVLPAGSTLVTNPEDVVVLAQEVKEEVEEVTEAPDMDAIAVEKKGKEEEEDQDSAS